MGKTVHKFVIGTVENIDTPNPTVYIDFPEVRIQILSRIHFHALNLCIFAPTPKLYVPNAGEIEAAWAKAGPGIALPQSQIQARRRQKSDPMRRRIYSDSGLFTGRCEVEGGLIIH